MRTFYFQVFCSCSLLCVFVDHSMFPFRMIWKPLSLKVKLVLIFAWRNNFKALTLAWNSVSCNCRPSFLDRSPLRFCRKVLGTGKKQKWQDLKTVVDQTTFPASWSFRLMPLIHSFIHNKAVLHFKQELNVLEKPSVARERRQFFEQYFTVHSLFICPRMVNVSNWHFPW